MSDETECFYRWAGLGACVGAVDQYDIYGNPFCHLHITAGAASEARRTATVLASRLAALETVAEVARRAVDAIDDKPWAVAWLVVAELNTALDALGGSPTEDPA